MSALPAQNAGAKPRRKWADTRATAIFFGSQVVGLTAAVLGQSLLAHALRLAGRGAAAICLHFGALAGPVFALGAASGARYCVMAKQLTVSQAAAAGIAIVLGASVAAAGICPVLGSDGLSPPGLLGAISPVAAEAAGSHHEDHEEDEQGPAPQRCGNDDHCGADTLIRLCIGKGEG